MKQIQKTMRQLFLLTSFLITLSAGLQAQSLFKTLKQVAKERVADSVMNKASTAIEKPAATPASTQQQPSSASTSATEVAPNVTAYSKYDFVPGQSIIYYEDFSAANTGELPVGWNSNGSGTAVTLSAASGKWLKLGQSSIYLAPDKIPATDDFTIEFDLMLQFTPIGAQGFPTFRFGALATDNGTENGSNSLLRDQKANRKFQVTLAPAVRKKSEVMLESFQNDRGYYSDPFKSYSNIENYFGKVSHVAIQVQKERLRVWINGDKLYEMPKGIAPGNRFNQLFFALGSSAYTEDGQCVAISNIRMANGLPDTRKQLLDNGSYSTTGILFDVNSATIQPESSGVMADLAAALTASPDMKVKIIGHTDADGNAASNQVLSLARANAVKEKLATEYGISADRLQTDGAGSSMPVANDKTAVGKAQNRRVEFTKQ